MASDMLRHLGRVARRKRQDADVMLAEVAARFRIVSGGKKKTEGALSRFERGETQPNYIDFVMDAYATELHLDAEELWSAALADWLKEAGAADPRLEPTEPSAGAPVDAPAKLPPDPTRPPATEADRPGETHTG